MVQIINKKVNSRFGTGDQGRSDFVVDLRKMLDEKEQELLCETEKIEGRVVDRIKSSTKKTIHSWKKHKKNEWAPSIGLVFREKKVQKLMVWASFIVLAKPLAKIFYKLGHAVWTALFFLLKLLLSPLRILFKLFVRIFIHKPQTVSEEIAEDVGRISTAIHKTHLYRRYWLKSAIGLGIFLLALIIPLKGVDIYRSIDWNTYKNKFISISGTAANDFMEASRLAGDLNLNEAGIKFHDARENFAKAQQEIEAINGIFFSLVSVIPQEKIQLAVEGKKIIDAGVLASELGSSLSMSMDYLYSGSHDEDYISRSLSYLERATSKAIELNIIVEDIEMKSLPAEYRDQFISLRDGSAKLAEALPVALERLRLFAEIMGVTSDKRYLLVFQNNTEMRASGGFIGSYALVDYHNGQIKNLEIPEGGSYDLRSGMRQFIVAPEPLQLLSARWNFWDANWWPDWPTTARKLAWFYEKSGGPSVDGVISFSPNVLEKLLEITGPIDMTEDYGMIIDSTNFWYAIQSVIEVSAEKNESQAYNAPEISSSTLSALSDAEKEKPKKIIGSLMKRILAELPARISRDNADEFASVFDELVAGKHLMMYFMDDDLEARIRELGLAGNMREVAGDYLSVVNTNIGGGKSDFRIEQSVEHRAEMGVDGVIVDTVKIIRKHIGEAREPFYGVRNVDWIRVYVPEGSVLLDAKGFVAPDDKYFKTPESNWILDADLENERRALKHATSDTLIYSENGKTVFANWSMLDPGQSIEITLRYSLPFTLRESSDDSWTSRVNRLLNPSEPRHYQYSFYYQIQPGMKPGPLNSALVLPLEYRQFYAFPDQIREELGEYRFSSRSDRDLFYLMVLEK